MKSVLIAAVFLAFLSWMPAGAQSTRPASRPGAAALPASRPAAGIKNVLFICDCTTSSAWFLGAHKGEVLRAVQGLRPDQSFNIFLNKGTGIIAMQKGFFLAASEENKRRAEAFLGTGNGGDSRLDEAIKMALNWKPDAICIASVGECKDPEATLRVVRDAGAKKGVPIHTTLKFARFRPEHRHFLWQLAKDSGGACLDENGHDAAEPIVPTPTSRPASLTPATRPAAWRIE